MTTNNNSNGSLVPVILYNNADVDKLRIYSDNKGKAGIYMWTHIESGKRYVGSAYDLSKRLSNYFSKAYLEGIKTSYICNALKSYQHSAFSLAIIEYVDILNVSKEDARLLIIKREQFFIDKLKPEFNINPIAGSRLGSKHNEESKALMGEAKIGKNNPMFGKKGENNHLFGILHSVERIAKISGENNNMYGKTHSDDSKNRMSISKGTAIYVYSSDKSKLIYTFPSARKAAEHFKCGHSTIIKFTKNGELFKEQWILSSTMKEDSK